jgi:hypothetical protein
MGQLFKHTNEHNILWSSVFVAKEWEGPIVLGYRGFLERIRFALDPGVVPGEQMFYFGLAE